MSKKNYNKISTEAAKANIEPEKVETVVNNEGDEVKVIETSEGTVVLPAVVGVVTGCSRLNVRSKPNIKSDVLEIVDAGKEFAIDERKSTNAFYAVYSYNSGERVEGFVMKKYITIKK